MPRRRVALVLYINLDVRLDRRALIEAEIEAYSEALPERRHRIAGVPMGTAAGCSLAHAAALAYFESQPDLGSSDNAVLILEDDAMFEASPEALKRAIDDLEERDDWDVAFFAHRVTAGEPPDRGNFQRVRSAYTASAYVVSRRYAPKLRACYLGAADAYLAEPDRTKHALDVQWTPLMQRDTWIAHVPRLARQRPSWSDLEHRFVDHGV